ncbi:hypothetical protein WR25_03525 [Diploscapter pachys]|uniref:DSBA-like thioredoxin domain-containing protein n=1 Tax=Diploscapter pachys TaxID=2018661 RepID=A0A2A2JCA5_9BILA|nr:hypothetical protein WR25_03525 [Diploscapter pachys]
MSASQALKGVGRLTNLQFYFDINCPNSWRAIKYFETRPDLNGLIDYIPAYTFRIYLYKNGLANSQRPKFQGVGAIKFIKWSEECYKFNKWREQNTDPNARIVGPVKRDADSNWIPNPKPKLYYPAPEPEPEPVQEVPEPETDRLSVKQIEKPSEPSIITEIEGCARPKRFYWPTVEYTAPELTYRLDKNWQIYYLTWILESAAISSPTTFLGLIKSEFPDLYMKAIHHLGTALWENYDSIFWAPKLCKCAREIGLSFRDTEDLVSRLSHPKSRKLITQSSDRAIQLGATSTPFFTLNYEDTEEMTHFGDVNELPKHL